LIFREAFAAALCRVGGPECMRSGGRHIRLWAKLSRVSGS
jgi:hypothetical protein